MRTIRKGENRVTKELVAPCCDSLVEVTPEDVIGADTTTYEFKCCECETVFWYAINYFRPYWLIKNLAESK